MDFSKLDLDKHQDFAREIVLKAIKENLKSRQSFQKFRNKFIKEKKGVIFHNLYFIKAYEDLLKEKKIKPNEEFLRLIKKRSVRTQSGVAPVTVLTKPYPCPGKCVYCPTDVRMPKSYLSSQPAAQRAYRQRFNPYTQVYVRLKALKSTGHEISKIDLRIIGGTWSHYLPRYQKWFIKRCIQALNEFPRKSALKQEQFRKSKIGSDKISTLLISPIQKNIKFDEVLDENETALIRCIGINVETRPDFINQKEIKRLRSLGVTKVEMGVQTVFEEVQKITKRGHDLETVKNATSLLKDSGFKVSYHMMPNLPGSNPSKDIKMFKILFDDEGFKPDYLKIYPCVVLPKTALEKSLREGKYKTYSDKILKDILKQNLKDIPKYCRLDRLARDIPANEIKSGFKSSNIRQIIEQELKKECVDISEIRYREIKDQKILQQNIRFDLYEYKASKGEEIFLSFEDAKSDKLIALLRFRFPKKTFLKELKNCALIRELHVYGEQVAVGKMQTGGKQHFGFGKRLMLEAEKLAKENNFKKIAVISGIGVREYYKKLGYQAKGSYMVKEL